MEYTQSDVDQILKASEKATGGNWKLYEDGSWRYEDRKNEEVIVVYDYDIYETIAGTPILAEEVKRLRVALNLSIDAMYEAVHIAPIDRMPGKCVEAIQEAQHVLGR